MMKIRDVLIGFVVSAIVVGIAVSCGGGSGSSGPTGPATYTVSGALTGATGTVVLKLNGGSDVSMANGPFTFATMLANGATYNVQVVDASDHCTVTDGAGTIVAASIANVAVACAAPASETVVRSTELSGAQESPAVVTSATGTGGVIFDPGTGGITGGVTVSNVTPTAVKLLQTTSGAPNEIATLGAAADGKTFFIPAGTTLVDAGQIASLRAGELYFDVFTNAHPAPGTGEIRGQINLQGGVLAGVSGMDNGQEVGGCTGKTTTGQGTVIVDRATGNIKVSYMTHDVTTASAAHIHTSVNPLVPACATTGGPTCSGGVIVNFTPLSGPPVPNPAYQTVAESQMTPTNLTHFLANYLYFNIHSASDGCPGGEIRGNITALQ